MPEKEFDLMVVGELNVDLIMDRLKNLPELGKEQRAEEMELVMGSSSAIFACNCSSLGLNVAFSGMVGTDMFGKFVMESLSASGVNTDAVIADSRYKTGATVIYNYGNDRMMVTHPGAMEHLTVEDIPDTLFDRSRHLHTSSIFFQPGIRKDLVKLFRRAKSHGLSTSMDAQWDPDEKWDLDLRSILPHLDFFLPNDQELMHLTRSDSVEEALDKLKPHSTVIVVKMGVRGSVMQVDGERTWLPPYHVPDFSDAIGAGDSYNAGFIRSWLHRKPLEECMKLGNMTAAVSTTAYGGTAAIRSLEQVIQKAENYQLMDQSETAGKV